jgi:carotenoid cleavage dioxygenase
LGEPAFKFERETPSRFGIVPRHGDNSTIRWFECSTCFVPHTLNAYEEGEEVVLIACRMENSGLLEPAAETASDPNENSRPLYEWRFNLSTGTVREQVLDDVSSEFPRVNEQLLGRHLDF